MTQAVERTIIHYPQLDTVLMVEEFIRDNSGEFHKKKTLGIFAQENDVSNFCVIIDYLLDSGKIAQDKEGTIAWIWDADAVKKYLSNKNLMWKKMNSKIAFGNEKIAVSLEKLKSGKTEDTQLYDWLVRAFEDLEKDAFSGIQIPTKLVPKEYGLKYGKIDNLWKYNLPNAWRLIYTVKKGGSILNNDYTI